MSTPEDRHPRRPHPDDPAARPPPEPGDPRYYDPDAEPATVGDVKNLRRWMIVALVWAVAASAIALLALLDDDNGGNGDEDRSSSSSATRVERRLEARIEELDQRVERAPSSGDIEDLGDRLDEVESQVEGLGDAPSDDSIDQLDERIDGLEQRVEDLENEPPPEDDAP